MADRHAVIWPDRRAFRIDRSAPSWPVIGMVAVALGVCLLALVGLAIWCWRRQRDSNLRRQTSETSGLDGASVLASVGLLMAGLVTQPWVTYLVITTLYVVSIPVAIARFYRARARAFGSFIGKDDSEANQ